MLKKKLWPAICSDPLVNEYYYQQDGATGRKIQLESHQSKDGNSMASTQPQLKPSRLLVLRTNAANSVRKEAQKLRRYEKDIEK